MDVPQFCTGLNPFLVHTSTFFMWFQMFSTRNVLIRKMLFWTIKLHKILYTIPWCTLLKFAKDPLKILCTSLCLWQYIHRVSYYGISSAIVLLKSSLGIPGRMVVYGSSLHRRVSWRTCLDPDSVENRRHSSTSTRSGGVNPTLCQRWCHNPDIKHRKLKKRSAHKRTCPLFRLGECVAWMCSQTNHDLTHMNGAQSTNHTREKEVLFKRL